MTSAGCSSRIPLPIEGEKFTHQTSPRRGRSGGPKAGVSRLPGQSIGAGPGEPIPFLLFLRITREVGLHLFFESLPEPILRAGRLLFFSAR